MIFGNEELKSSGKSKATVKGAFRAFKTRKMTGVAPADPPVTVSDAAATHEEEEGLYPNLLA